MNKWIAEFDLEDGDTMPEHMDLNYMGAKIDFHCRPMWIPVSEGLPEEKINPITEDFYEYQCTYHAYGVYDVRSYKFGDGHWWHGPGIVDDCVIAWRPSPEPYKAESEEVE